MVETSEVADPAGNLGIGVFAYLISIFEIHVSGLHVEFRLGGEHPGDGNAPSLDIVALAELLLGHYDVE